MALLDTPQAMYGSMSSPYLMQNPYSRVQGYYRDYEQETIARLNIHQRLQVSPEYSSRSVKEEFGTAFKPYSPGQENLPTQTNNHSKVFTTLLKISHVGLKGFGELYRGVSFIVYSRNYNTTSPVYLVRIMNGDEGGFDEKVIKVIKVMMISSSRSCLVPSH